MAKQLSAETIELIQTDAFTLQVLEKAVSILLTELDEDQTVAPAIMPLFIRIANTFTSVYSLARHSEQTVRDRCQQDIGALFRIIFEAFLQLEYILHDPSNREQRARDYVDFGVVERMKQHRSIMRHDSSLSKFLKLSPKRQSGEVRLQSEFARVADRFAKRKTKSRSKLLSAKDMRTNWYVGTLADVARATGYETQYDTWITMYHGSIHSSISGCRSGILLDLEYAPFWASQVAAHAAGRCLGYAAVELPGQEGEWLEAMNTGVLGEIPEYVFNDILRSRGQMC